MASVVLVTMSACGNSVPDVAPSASTSPSESQAPVQKSPRADAQALVVQACNAYDATYKKELNNYLNYFQEHNTGIEDPTLIPALYKKMKPIWNPLAQAALEDARWSQTLADFNYLLDLETGGGYSSALPIEQARTGFQSSCEIARSSSRVSLEQ